MKFIAIFGAPSSGKTTLAAALTRTLQHMKISVRFVEEYAREYIREVGDADTSESQRKIFFGQMGRELEALASPVSYSILDGPSFLTCIYCKNAVRTKHDTEIWQNLFPRVLSHLDENLKDAIFFYTRPSTFRMDGIRDVHQKIQDRLDTMIRGFADCFLDYTPLQAYDTPTRISGILHSLGLSVDEDLIREACKETDYDL